MKFKKVLILFFILIFCTSVYCQEKSVVYIMDNSYLGENTKEYFNELKTKLNYSDKVILNAISKYDINTTESLNILKKLKKGDTAIVLKIGEANYYNLYGFSSFKRFQQKSTKNRLSSVRDISFEIAKQYGIVNENSIGDLIDIVGKQIFMSDKKFKPFVIPKFYALNYNFNQNINIASSVNSYTYAWNLINEKKFDQAYSFLIKIINKQPNNSMFHYALGSLYLMKKDDKYQENALRAFEDGILADPFNKDNMCYKGLVVMFMMYEGKIIKDILFFSILLNKYMPDYSKDISAILAIGNAGYEQKIEMVNEWILFDIKQIKQVCNDKNIDLILTSYPVSVKSEKIIKKYASENKTVLFMDDKMKANESLSDWIGDSVSKLYRMLKQKGFINE